MKFGVLRRSGVAVLLGVSLFSVSARAQENASQVLPDPQRDAGFASVDPNFFENLAPVTPEVPAPVLYRVDFPVRNIKASLMAYWLDPAHQQMPIDLQLSEMLGGGDLGPAFFEYSNSQALTGEMRPAKPLPRLPGNGKGPDGVKLPQGATRIVAVDSQNKLLVWGSKEGLKALSVLLPTLDVPLVQYETEAQFVQISRTDLRATGLDFGETPWQGPYLFGAVATVPATFNTGALIESKRAKVISAPRVTAIDGLTASLRQTTSTPCVLDLGRGSQVSDSGSKQRQSVAYISTTIGIRATPMQTKDGLIALSITPTLGTRTLSVSTTVRDGRPFAIQMSPTKDDTQIVVIVTLRRIRRVGDAA